MMKAFSAAQRSTPSRLRHLALAPSALAICLALGTMGAAQARPQKLGNMGQGLRELVELHQARTTAGLRSGQGQLRAALVAGRSKASNAVIDKLDRVRVDIHMDGTLPLPAFRSSAAWTGLQPVAESSTYRHGVMTAFVPAAQLVALARLPGVKSVILSHAPRTNVMLSPPAAGSVVSQGVGVMKSDQVNALGYVGRGVTIGALSDSYDADTTALTHAAGDVATGDLPGVGNAYNSAPVVVVDEAADPSGVADEGRAMLQLVHDIAPAAKLCFASAFNGEVSFANNILALANPAGSCKANIIVDDVFYYDEPFFSDGIVAQAVDAVAAAGVSYFSSAGNQGTAGGYQSNVRPVSYAAAVASNPTVNLNAIGGAAAAPGGFHNFSAVPGVIDIAQTVTVGSAGLLTLQWDDVFNAGKVTTDFDIYLFDSTGNLLPYYYSGLDNNLPGGTDQAIEYLYFPDAGTYQLVIARYTAPTDTPAPAATRLRYINFAGATAGEYLEVNSPVTFGHSAARGAISTAAVPWFQAYQPEYYTSPGPSTIFFDAAGIRLPVPEIRLKPDIAAPDGGNTTFFYGDTSEDSDTLPNFFGTSAAAPAAAGVAALVMEKAGGPTRVRPSQMRQVLQSTAHAHNLQAGYVDATAVVGPVKVTVSATDNIVQSSIDPNTFKVSMAAPAGYTLQSVTIDLSTANAQRVRLGIPRPGLQFDASAGTGYPATKGELKNILAGDVSFSSLSSSAPYSQQLTVSFAAGKFGGKSSVSFGVDRDEAASNAGGNAVDLLAGAKVTGMLVGPSGTMPFTTTFQPRQFGKGYSVVDGYGLIDALGAVNAPLP